MKVSVCFRWRACMGIMCNLLRMKRPFSVLVSGTMFAYGFSNPLPDKELLQTSIIEH